MYIYLLACTRASSLTSEFSSFKERMLIILNSSYGARARASHGVTVYYNIITAPLSYDETSCVE